MYKRLLSLFLAMAMLAIMAGCASQATPEAPAAAPAGDTAAEPAAEPAQETAAEPAAEPAEEAAAEPAGEPVTLEFIQWWEPELPAGEFRALMDEFEAQNPGIKVELISGPYSSTKEQVIAGAVAGTMSDVVGLDGAWVSDFVKQGSIANLSDLMAQAGYDDSELASQIQLNGGTYMIPVVNFVYPVFVNLDLMEQAGIAAPPATRSEFADAAAALTDEASNTYGWVLPLSMEQPNGIQNDVMSWVWASGGSMMKDGMPDLTNDDVRSGMEFIKGLYDAGVIAPGAFSMKEQDKVEEFTNGRVGMMVDSLAHINLIRERNPDLNFAITALPAEDGYTGKRGLPYASWGIGVSATSEHQAEAWKLVQFLMSAETNSKLSSIANAFPGNVNSTPDFVTTDDLFGAAFKVFQEGYLANEFVGLPVAEDLMRQFDEQFQPYLDGGQSLDDTLNNAQASWMENFDASAAAQEATAPEPAAEPLAEPVTLEFIQWWEPELPAGEFRALMDEFEAQNPGIKVELISGPYSSTKEQVIAGAVAGTMSDVVGLDGAWVSDFVKQGSIANLTDLMAQAGYDDSELASQIQLNGGTYMIPVVNFVYPVFVNLDLMEQAGIAAPPATRSEFADAAAALTDEANNTYGWVLPLSMEQPNGIQNDVMSWVWASGGSMMKDGMPDLTNDDVRSGMEFIKGLYDAGVIAPGAFSMKEQDKVEEFTNGRVGMMVDSLAHINLIRERNPDLNFAITALPAEDGYTGKRGLPYASWGIGVSATSEHQAEAWKLVQFLMSAETNSKLSSIANAFPGNVNSTPDFVTTDDLFGAAFGVFQEGYLANEFVGLPVAEDLMRQFDEQFQPYLDGSQSLDDTLNNAQESWMESFQ